MTYIESASREILALLREYGQMVFACRVARDFVAVVPTPGYTGALRMTMDDNHGHSLQVIVQRDASSLLSLEVGRWEGHGRNAPWCSMFRKEGIDAETTSYLIEDALNGLSATV
jgi:hypothetical protein